MPLPIVLGLTGGAAAGALLAGYTGATDYFTGATTATATSPAGGVDAVEIVRRPVVVTDDGLLVSRSLYVAEREGVDFNRFFTGVNIAKGLAVALGGAGVLYLLRKGGK